jgi:hypothetical protein
MKAIVIDKIEKAIQSVINGFASQYINCTKINGESIKIRVSNHKSNPKRMDDNDISLVIYVPEKESETDEYCNFAIAKKNFHDIRNQYFLDENGSFEEQFHDVEDLLNWHEIDF